MFDIDLGALIRDRGKDCLVVDHGRVPCPRCGSTNTETRVTAPAARWDLRPAQSFLTCPRCQCGSIVGGARRYRGRWWLSRCFMTFSWTRRSAPPAPIRAPCNCSDRSVNGLRVVASRGFDPSFLQFFATVRVEDSCVCGSALRQAGRVIVPNVTTSEIFKGAPSREVLRNADVRSVQATPIFSRARWLIGVISTHWTSDHWPSDEELARLDVVVLRAARQIASN